MDSIKLVGLSDESQVIKHIVDMSWLVPKLPEQNYQIDWDKVQTLDDMKRVMRAIQVSFSVDCPQVADIMDIVYIKDN